MTHDTSDSMFKYNDEYKYYFVTKKLDGGYIARIYFVLSDTDAFKSHFRAYNVSLAISKSKRDLNNWIAEKGTHSVNTNDQFIGYGISVLIWAKSVILEFMKMWEYQRCTLYVSGSNARRYNIYKHYLKNIGFNETSSLGESYLVWTNEK